MATSTRSGGSAYASSARRSNPWRPGRGADGVWGARARSARPRPARAAATWSATAPPRSGWTAATARSPTCRSTSAVEDLDAVVITHEHPDHCVDVYGLHILLRYGMEKTGFPIFGPEGLETHLGQLVDGDWGETFEWNEIDDNDATDVGEHRVCGSRAPTTRRPRTRSKRRPKASDWCTPPTPVRSGRSARSVPVPTSCCRKPRTCTTRRRPTTRTSPRSEAGIGAREAGAHRLVLTHLWPGLDRRPRGRRRVRRVRRIGDPRRAAPHLPGLTEAAPVGIRRDGREPADLRPIAFTRDFTEFAAGSVLVEFGRTHVLCTASVETRVPPWLRGKGRGWVTAEYSMLPGSTQDRVEREAQKGRPSGRTQEIQRLIGRSLRAVTDLNTMGEVQITVDCDVLQADGGTRTASICGGYVALHDACTPPRAERAPRRAPAHRPVRGDLGRRRRRAPVPRPRVLRGRARRSRHERGDDRCRRFVEVQGTAEGVPFTRSELDQLLDLAEGGIREIFALQREVLAEPPAPRPSASRRRRRDDRSCSPPRTPTRRRRSRASSPTPARPWSSCPAPPTCPKSRRPAPTLEANARLKAVGPGRGHRPAGDRRRHRARSRRPRRRAGRVLGPLRRPRRHLRRQLHPPAPTARRRPDRSAARPASPPWPWPAGPTAGRSPPSARSRARSPRRPAGEEGFGYDPVFVPTEGDGRTLRRDDGRRRSTRSRIGAARSVRSPRACGMIECPMTVQM